MARRRDEYIAPIFFEHPFIFALDDGRAEGCFLDIKKTERLERFSHGADARAVVVGYKRGGKAGDDRRAALQKYFDFFKLTGNFLGVLGASDKTLPAVNAFIMDDVGLIARKSNGLDRAVPYALVAVAAVGFF